MTGGGGGRARSAANKPSQRSKRTSRSKRISRSKRRTIIITETTGWGSKQQTTVYEDSYEEEW